MEVRALLPAAVLSLVLARHLADSLGLVKTKCFKRMHCPTVDVVME